MVSFDWYDGVFANDVVAEFAFYVNRSGWRARPQFMVHWVGYPTAFGTLRFITVKDTNSKRT